jgi:hypothetical protein
VRRGASARRHESFSLEASLNWTGESFCVNTDDEFHGWDDDDHQLHRVRMFFDDWSIFWYNYQKDCNLSLQLVKKIPIRRTEKPFRTLDTMRSVIICLEL